MTLAVSSLAALLALAAPPPVAGMDKAANLPGPALQALKHDGSVRLAGREVQFFALYDRNAYERVPHFVSLDVALHLFHARLDAIVAAVERERAVPALRAFSQGQATRAAALFSKTHDERFALLALYHALPFALLGGDAATLQLEPVLAARVDGSVKAVRESRGPEAKLCGRGVDASLFKPRGHYTGDLAGYFQAITLYSQCAFDLDEEDGFARALDIARLADAESLAQLDRVRALAELLAGPPDDVDLAALLKKLPAPAPAALPVPLAPDAQAALAREVRQLPPGRIPTQQEEGEAPVRLFRLIGGAAEVDSSMFSQTAQVSGKLPSVLQLLAALGSKDASKLMGESGDRAAQPASLSSGKTLFERWLAVLQMVVRSPEPGAPSFEQTDAWARHLTVAAAGSWAELRHDTLLYVKRPRIVWAQGGDSEQLPPKASGYVEPRPEVYRALADLVTSVAAQLGPGGNGRPGDSRALVDFLKFLADVSDVELAGKRFPKELDDRLQFIGTEMEDITRAGADEPPPQALICDVFDLVDQKGKLTTLEVGTGYVDELYVIVEVGGRRMLTRGGVFSYYEFGSEERLDDAEWRARLEKGRAPERPSWARPSGKAPAAKARPQPAPRGTMD